MKLLLPTLWKAAAPAGNDAKRRSSNVSLETLSLARHSSLLFKSQGLWRTLLRTQPLKEPIAFEKLFLANSLLFHYFFPSLRKNLTLKSYSTFEMKVQHFNLQRWEAVQRVLHGVGQFIRGLGGAHYTTPIKYFLLLCSLRLRSGKTTTNSRNGSFTPTMSG